MMRKLLFAMGLAALAAAPVMVMAQDAELEPWACPEGFEGQTLSVYNWSTYVAEDTISNFEALCGVTVNYDVFGNNEEVIARLRQGNPGYDIVVPTDYAVTILAAEGLLEELDQANIPNLANVTESLLDQPFDPGNVYSVPYQWGTIGVGYNVNAFPDGITSWSQLWAHEGPVAWLDDQRGVMGIALNLLGLDPNTQEPADIEAARDFLIENGSNVQVFAADDGQAQLLAGNVDATIEYNGDIFQLNVECECEDYVYVVPEEGAQLWMDNLAIPMDAPNKALAEVFIDYILDPQVGADISNYTAYGSPNQAAIDAGLIDEELLTNPGIYPPEEIMMNLYSLIDVPDAEVDYSLAWDEVKVSLSR
ncbi:MAG: spermidine/putrescine ABC transporter substrate-binding protein [Pleurocapsa minor GSE-CHR-MK-17-07R]|jgi:spermidine/putrescine transport system substrate-binding protein|nr:spermidine/putrescine ABC transporter substrate-binding protein [Pleurocapsa minor GSE-CHR-MK 17-07R]